MAGESGTTNELELEKAEGRRIDYCLLLIVYLKKIFLNEDFKRHCKLYGAYCRFGKKKDFFLFLSVPEDFLD